MSVASLIAAGKAATRLVLERIARRISREPDVAFATADLKDGRKRKRKQALRIDMDAEDSFSDELLRRVPGITVYGEERLADESLDLANQRGTFALVDAVDGTDLLERGLGNWCTTAVLFQPRAKRGERIVAAFVGLPTGDVYFASRAHPGASVQHEVDVPLKRSRTKKRAPISATDKRIIEREVYGPSPKKTLRAASVYFYGQKLKNLLPTVNALQNAAALSADDEEKRKSATALAGLRLYNLAGTPMMIRMIDRKYHSIGGVDVVMDIVGQKPHDVVPGAFIALKAGASLLRLDGTRIEYTDLEDLLLRPAADRLTYVLAGTHPLAQATVEFLREGMRASF